MSGGPLRAEDRESRAATLAGWPVRVVSYRLGPVWHCEIDNVDPGAQVARDQGETRAAAEAAAIEKAERRLGRTRVHG